MPINDYSDYSHIHPNDYAPRFYRNISISFMTIESNSGTNVNYCASLWPKMYVVELKFMDCCEHFLEQE